MQSFYTLKPVAPFELKNGDEMWAVTFISWDGSVGIASRCTWGGSGFETADLSGRAV